MPTSHPESCIICCMSSIVGGIPFTHLRMFLPDKKIKACCVQTLLIGLLSGILIVPSSSGLCLFISAVQKYGLLDQTQIIGKSVTFRSELTQQGEPINRVRTKTGQKSTSGEERPPGTHFTKLSDDGEVHEKHTPKYLQNLCSDKALYRTNC